MNKNVILVTVDSLRNDCYNPKISDYPFLNYLSNHSTYFSNCFSLGENTETTFPQFLTSTYLNLIPYKKHNKSKEVNQMCRIESPRKSIAETMRDEGYNTYSFQTSPSLSPIFGYDKGFDVYKYINPFSSTSLPFFIKYLYKLPYTNIEEISSLVIKEKFEPPFFLWIHLNDVHEPYYSPRFPKLLSDFLWSQFTSRPSYSDLANLLLPKISKNMADTFKNLYLHNLKYLDKQLYSLFLDSNKFNIDESLFILSSDHGQVFGERNQWGHGYSVLPTRESSNVPLFISDSFQNESKNDSRFCSTMDMVPTVLEMVDLPLLDIYDGHSLRDKNWPGHKELVWSNSLDFDNNLYSIRIFDEPYIFWQDDFNFRTPRIFIIEDNRLQIIKDEGLMKKYKNIALEHINFIKSKQLKYPFNKNHKSTYNEELDRDVFEALRSLGYV